MTRLEEIVEQMEKYGFPILNELFKLNSKEIKETVRDILTPEWFDSKCGGMLSDGTVIKTIEDDQPKKIEIWFYDGIEITWSGIYYLPEHGDRKCMRDFDKYFRLPEPTKSPEKCRFFDPCQGRNKCLNQEVNDPKCKGVCDKYLE